MTFDVPFENIVMPSKVQFPVSPPAPPPPTPTPAVCTMHISQHQTNPQTQAYLDRSLHSIRP